MTTCIVEDEEASSPLQQTLFRKAIEPMNLKKNGEFCRKHNRCVDDRENVTE